MAKAYDIIRHSLNQLPAIEAALNFNEPLEIEHLSSTETKITFKGKSIIIEDGDDTTVIFDGQPVEYHLVAMKLLRWNMTVAQAN